MFTTSCAAYYTAYPLKRRADEAFTEKGRNKRTSAPQHSTFE
jgi:hypothetical protein